MFDDRDYLNPELKDMFFALDLIESYGSGIRRAKRAMAANGSPALVFTPDNETDDYTMATAKVISRKTSEDAPSFLPQLCADITLERGSRMLIIDAKCYGHILGTHHDKEILSPARLNQIQSYVIHAAYGTDLDVQGMLLCVLTETESERHESWGETGRTLHCRTLDLGQEFSGIAAQLDEVAELIA